MLNLPDAFLGFARMARGAFGGPFHAGQIIDQGEAAIDDGGSIVTPAAPVYRDCLVQIDLANEALRLSEGYTDGDVRFIILSSSFIGSLDTDANVRVVDGPFAGTWMVSQLSRDTVGIGWSGRGRRA